jgi:hypothetical protein
MADTLLLQVREPKSCTTQQPPKLTLLKPPVLPHPNFNLILQIVTRIFKKSNDFACDCRLGLGFCLLRPYLIVYIRPTSPTYQRQQMLMPQAPLVLKRIDYHSELLGAGHGDLLHEDVGVGVFVEQEGLVGAEGLVLDRVAVEEG